jgi:hypothetical protein
MFGLQVFQLPHQLVEFGVGNLGLVDNVIQVFVVADFLTEGVDLLLDKLLGVFGRDGHCQDYKWEEPTEHGGRAAKEIPFGSAQGRLSARW